MVEEIYKYIVEYKKETDGNSPTLREIQSKFGISSTSVVTYYINKLIADGRIVKKSLTGRRPIHFCVTGGVWTPPRIEM